MWKEKLASTPKEALNLRLFFAVLVFGLMGAARGLDEGIIGTTLKQDSFVAEFGLDDPNRSADYLAQRESNITSTVQLGSIGGALIAFFLCDKLGRVRATQELCLVWMVGNIIVLTSKGSYGQLLAGRVIMGLGIGQTVVTAPTYLAEVSPRAIRGLCTTMFSGFVYLGIMLGYFASYGTSLHISSSSARQWIIPASLHMVFAGTIFTLTFFSLESPRWLLKVGRSDQAADVLSRLRRMPISSDYVSGELADIQTQLGRERESVGGSGFVSILKELFTLKANMYRMFLGIGAQLLGQWSGANSITIYAPQYFEIVGIASNTSLLTTAVFGVVKFVAAMTCSLFLIDFIGRKRSLGIGITLQFISILYIGLFIYLDPGASTEQPQSSSQTRAGTAAIVMIYISGWGWAMGWNSVQYLINAEIFPLRLRSVGTSIVMTLHFVNQYGNTKAVPLMFLALTHGGTMIFFAVVTLIGFFWVIFFVPELAGKSLESIDEVFDLPWYQIGLRGGKIKAEEGQYARDMGGDGSDIETYEHVEKKV